ncbi:MAG: GNAT family N-acetyltransferase [Rhodospirillales bacterium]
MAPFDHRAFAVRAATAIDLAALPEIERQAHSIFYGMAGLGAVAERPPTTIDRLRRGPCWLAAQQDGRIVGFIVADQLEGDTLIETLAILPEFSGAGLGRALVGAATEWGKEIGMGSVLVAAYRDIPWDAPFYARLGFSEVPHRQWSSELHRLRREATLLGHDPARRLWMRLSLN